jgi:hypothetical protein
MEENVNFVSLIIRPQDSGWAMGEDWEISRPESSTILDLKIYIEEHKNISRHRQHIRVKGKIVVASRESWNLRRTGLYDGNIVNVEPTLSGSWYWNNKEYYELELVNEVLKQIETSHENLILYSILEETIKCPPPIKTSLRTVLRKYPDKIHLHCDTATNAIWCRKTIHLFDLPTFYQAPPNLDSINTQNIQIEEFDWESYADVDDTNEYVEEEEEKVEVAVEEKSGLEIIENSEKVLVTGE